MDRPLSYRYSEDELGFYVAASDQDMLSQINRIMHRSGYVGVMDTAGRMHYIVDGRRGSPFVSRRIMETTGRIIRDQMSDSYPLQDCLSQVVDGILAKHALRPELKGCRYLRYLLLLIGLDESKLRPISKTLYPEAARHFQVSIAHIERDIRYALLRTDLRQIGLTTTASVCRLYNEMILAAENLQKQEKPSSDYTNREGSPNVQYSDEVR